MAFDTATRNELQKVVGRARDLLVEEFTSQCQGVYGIQPDGSALDLSALAHLSAEEQTKAELLRDRVEHLAAGIAGSKKKAEAVGRLVREQAFTVLNRLCALRMCEERGLLQECVRNGYDSKGFKLFDQTAAKLGGDTFQRYNLFVQLLFDELAVDLGVLFDRFSLYGLLFPREAALKDLLALVNTTALTHIWAEDEAIGWVYQYFNSQEERQAMRKASAAPRNSRELAVRNQFFTPRYVVEFLTDNTLGRIWYEMRKGDTSLKETCRYLVRRPSEIFLGPDEPAPDEVDDVPNVSEEEQLKAPVYVDHRQKKDPRDLKILDPACGSGHFLLYAFDLLESIYREAWEDPESPESEVTGAPLREDFATLTELEAAIPELILRWNLYGIDIDPRAAQIAALSLWLRAQKAWQEQGIETADRPRVRKSNIVCSEPMPGEKDVLRDFASGLKPTVLGQLVEVVFDKMQLAGEAGSLLKIEEEIQSAIEEARRQWQTGPRPEQVELFPELAQPKQGEIQFDLTGVTRESFWNQAEERILKNLQAYADEAEGAEDLGRRLFADDAAQGFSFIDLCRNSFDVVLMNPPFGLVPDRTFSYLQREYNRAYVDVYAPFVERAVRLTPDGRIGAITSRSFLTSKKLSDFRRELILPRIDHLADLGKGVMDAANVEACAYTLSERSRVSAEILAVDLRFEQRKKILLLDYQATFGSVSRASLLALPDSMMIHFAPRRILDLFKHSEKFEPRIGTVRGGPKTFDDFRFLRLVSEVPPDLVGGDKKWQYFAKGGEYRKYYTDIHLVMNRDRDGAELDEVNRRVNGQTAQCRQASRYWYRHGAQYTDRSEKGFSARALPAGCVMSNNAPALLPESDISAIYILGWINSRLVRAMVEMQAIAKKFYPGFLKRLPWIQPSSKDKDIIEAATSELLNIHRAWESYIEIDPHFENLGLTSVEMGLSEQYDEFRLRFSEAVRRIPILQKTVSDSVDSVYAVDSASFAERILGKSVDEEVTLPEFGKKEFGQRLFSYLLGCAFGRWDVRKSIAKDLGNFDKEPFENLPILSPGMAKNISESSDKSDAEKYPLKIPNNGILVDDSNGSVLQPGNITNGIQNALVTIFDERAANVERQLSEFIGVAQIEDHIRRPSGFFAQHLTRYSRSRRKAPVYWPLSTESSDFTVWLYYPQLTDQTLYSSVNEYIDPKLQEIERDLSRLLGAGQADSKTRKYIDALIELQRELRSMREELLRVATLPYKPDQNDGVLITAAPLWRLFRHKPWQKELKKCWGALESGEYDWANLAYAIWPDRVRAVCKKDKSIAIAHGLEDLYEG